MSDIYAARIVNAVVSAREDVLAMIEARSAGYSGLSSYSRGANVAFGPHDKVGCARIRIERARRRVGIGRPPPEELTRSTVIDGTHEDPRHRLHWLYRHPPL